jgi:hypothetical protein
LDYKNERIGQANVGDCYLIAVLNALRKSDLFEVIMRYSIKKISGGWMVKVPLASANGKWIKIKKSDLKKIKNPQYHKKDKYGDLDRRVYLDPVAASKGIQLLEATFIKDKYGNDKIAAEGGFGNKAMEALFGDSVAKVRFAASDDIVNKKGRSQTVDGYSVSDSFANTDGASTKLYEIFKQHTINLDFAVMNSLPRRDSKYEDYKIFTGKYFYHNHAYSLVSVDKFKKTIDVEDPHDSDKTITLTYVEAAEAFSQYSGVKIDPKNMWKQ